MSSVVVKCALVSQNVVVVVVVVVVLLLVFVDVGESKPKNWQNNAPKSNRAPKRSEN